MQAIRTLGTGLYFIGWLGMIAGGGTFAYHYVQGNSAMAGLGMGTAGVSLGVLWLGKVLKD